MINAPHLSLSILKKKYLLSSVEQVFVSSMHTYVRKKKYLPMYTVST